ncbi:MAG: hypothetical protein ABIG89_03590 [Candidatus Woesearchaeota archaeon]
MNNMNNEKNHGFLNDVVDSLKTNAVRYATIAMLSVGGLGVAGIMSGCSPYFIGVRDGRSVCLEKICVRSEMRSGRECTGEKYDKECHDVTYLHCLQYGTKIVADEKCD